MRSEEKTLANLAYFIVLMNFMRTLDLLVKKGREPAQITSKIDLPAWNHRFFRGKQITDNSHYSIDGVCSTASKNPLFPSVNWEERPGY